LHAGKLISEAAQICGGKGGGKADFAQGAGKDPSKLERAINQIKELLRVNVNVRSN
jgi:alanyl-tRNA synthetase